MPLTQIDIVIEPQSLPAETRILIDDLNQRCNQFFDTRENVPHPHYQPSSPEALYHALNYIRSEGMELGDVFVELGSGLGLGVCVAASMGFEAHGIEIDPVLVDRSKQNLAELSIDAKIHCTSYFPEEFSSYSAHGGTELLRPPKGTTPYYQELDLNTEDIDIFYVYPWPHEQEFMLELFEAIAAEDALLVAYWGEDDINLYKKTL